jgi:myo-inositol-1(or 4)-monophosphatase
MIDLKQLCEQVNQLVLKTAVMIKSERQNFSSTKDVEIKGHSNFVTHIDKLSEQMLVDGLSLLLPEAGFIAEEGTSTKKGDKYNWVIDPIDGTTNFIHGLSPFAISIGLIRDSEVVLGVVYEISHDELFYAWEGSAAYLNHREIRVTNNGEHQQALIATGFPYYDFGTMENYLLVLRELMEKTAGLRRLGSAAIDICYVACGKFEAFWEYGLHPWDVAAGILILKQAGGKVCDFNGGDKFLFNGEIIATNTNYFDKFYPIVHQYLGK